MSKVRTVAVNEYLKAIRSKAFILGIVLMPVLMGGGAIAVAIAENTKDLDEQVFAVIDNSGGLRDEIETQLEVRNANLNDEEGNQDRARWALDDDVATGDDRPLDEIYSERVEAGEILGFLTVGKNVLSLEAGSERGLTWSTDTPTADDLPDWLEYKIEEIVSGNLIAAAGLTQGQQAKVDLANAGVRMRTQGLVSVNKATGERKEAEEVDEISQILIPIVLVMLMFMLVMMSTPILLNNVLEEKMQKIAEVLVSSVSPFELMLGKLGSAVAMSMTLALLYLGGALVFVHNIDGVPQPILDALNPGILAWFLFFMLLLLLTSGAIFSAIGAACSEIQDSQTLMMPAMIMLVGPLMFLGPVIQAPDGTLAQVLSFIPPMTPMMMFLRMAIPPGVPWWELALALLGSTLFTLFAVWAGGKIFRIGILFQGQTPSFKTLFGWLFAK